MASKFRLRIIFRPIIIILAKLLIKIGVSPNLATCIMFTFSVFSMIALIIFSNLLLFSLFVFLVGIFDGIDGAIARLSGRTTFFGAFFDSIMDRASEFVIFFSLLAHYRYYLLWNIIGLPIIIIVSFIASIMISYIRAKAENVYNGDFDVGLMARSERLFYIVISMIIVYFYGFIGEILFVFMLLVIVTAIFRFYKLNGLIKDFENQISNQ
ncbi:MAG: CDP-alcohol phosphatidyltransferase family protein [Promethearchaeota archaeon]|nr:MAG: CDP-alcohol phosphatidyltransferase family protein [Candidatus Lokiarchaeota archaeon]